MFEDIIKFQNLIHKNLSKSFNQIAIVQQQMRHQHMPVIEFQNRVIQNLQPVYSVIENFVKVNQQIGSKFIDVIKSQLNIVKKLSNENVLHNNVPETVSYQISEISSEVIMNIAEFKNENLCEKINTKADITYSQDKKVALTWQDVILIIGFIITLVTSILDQLPDSQLSQISQSLNQLIEIESKQLSLPTQSLNEELQTEE